VKRRQEDYQFKASLGYTTQQDFISKKQGLGVHLSVECCTAWAKVWAQSPAPGKTKESLNQAPVAHAYNPSYSAGRDQKEASLGKWFERPYLKNTHHKKKRAGIVAQGEGPEFKLQY
jgi:hypothetical protein